MSDLNDALDWVRKQSDIPAVQLATAYRAGANLIEAKITLGYRTFTLTEETER